MTPEQRLTVDAAKRRLALVWRWCQGHVGLCCIGVAAAMAVFPPWVEVRPAISVTGGGSVSATRHDLGFGFLLLPPKPTGFSGTFTKSVMRGFDQEEVGLSQFNNLISVQIDAWQLTIQELIVASVYAYVFITRRAGNDSRKAGEAWQA